MMTKTGMLVVTNPNKFIKFIPRISREIKSTLYIQICPRRKSVLKNDSSKNLPGVGYNSSVISVYKNSLGLRKLDVRLLLSGIRDPSLVKISTKKPIEVVYFDHLLNDEEMKGFLENCVENRSDDCQTISLDNEQEILEPEVNSTVSTNSVNETFNSVVLGGTFDRLHHGHKILLSQAILHCKRQLTVGVTDLEMLKILKVYFFVAKKLWELIEPCNERIERVREFLEDVEPNLDYKIIPISDMYGPTKDDPDFEMLVVSAETLGGGTKVNNLRVQNGLNPLVVQSVDLIPDEKIDVEEEDKVSSSNNRMRLLGSLLREPEAKPNLPPLPYIIGLTGGIASGKSSVSERLKNAGAGIINCDKVAHELYEKNTHFYFKIIEDFGRDILNEDGTINRRKLGDIVFNNKDELDKLNNLLWPAILDKSRALCSELFRAGHRIVVMEAAVLVQAGWAPFCHEVWTCIVPPEEAIKRLQDRNALSEEEAISRVSSQPSNVELVSNSHVVFCTLWRPEYTQKQVEKCWSELQERLDIPKCSKAIKN